MSTHTSTRPFNHLHLLCQISEIITKGAQVLGDFSPFARKAEGSRETTRSEWESPSKRSKMVEKEESTVSQEEVESMEKDTTKNVGRDRKQKGRDPKVDSSARTVFVPIGSTSGNRQVGRPHNNKDRGELSLVALPPSYNSNKKKAVKAANSSDTESDNY